MLIPMNNGSRVYLKEPRARQVAVPQTLSLLFSVDSVTLSPVRGHRSSSAKLTFALPKNLRSMEEYGSREAVEKWQR